MNVDIMFMMYIGTKFEDPETIARQRPKKEKEKEKQVGNYVFSAPVFVIAQGQLNYSTAKIENIKELKKFLNETKNMEMLENKGFDSNFLNQIKSDVDKKHNQYSKDINMNVYTNTKNALSNFNSSLNLSKSSQIEKKYNDFEKKIAYTPMEKKLENQLQKVAQTTTTQPKEVKKVEDEFSKGTLAWIEKEKGNYDKILAARKYLENNNLLKTSFDTTDKSNFLKGVSEKDLVIAHLLRKDSKGIYYLLEEDINGPGGYHAQITHKSDKEKTAKAYAIWKGGKSKEKELQMAKKETKKEEVEVTKAETKKAGSIMERFDDFNSFITNTPELIEKGQRNNSEKIKEYAFVFIAFDIMKNNNKFESMTAGEKSKEIDKVLKHIKSDKQFESLVTKLSVEYLMREEKTLNNIVKNSPQVEVTTSKKPTKEEVEAPTKNVETAKVVDVDYSKYTAEEINKLTPEQIEKLTLENIKAMEDILLGDGINMNVFDAIAKRETELKKIGNN